MLRLEADRGRVRGLRPVLLRGQRDAPRRRRAVLERVRRREARRSSSCCSSSCAARRRCCSTAACSRCGRTAMALALFTATQLPLVVAITTVAVDDGHMRSSTAAALVGAGALSTLAGPLHGLRMRRIAAAKRAGSGVQVEAAVPVIVPDTPERHDPPTARAPRGQRGRPPVPPAHLAELGDVGLRCSRPTWSRSSLAIVPAGPRPAPRRQRQPADRRASRGAGDLRRAGRRHDHVHRHRVLGGVRRRADPDVVLLPQARRAAAARPGRDRRPGAADRDRDLLAVRARLDRPPDRPLRAATSCPLPRCCSGCCSRSSRSARSSRSSSARSRARRSAASCARSCAAATR